LIHSVSTPIPSPDSILTEFLGASVDLLFGILLGKLDNVRLPNVDDNTFMKRSARGGKPWALKLSS
jgi:hypothetical protein